MAPGEAFLAKVYGWLTSNPDRCGRTVLIVTYDEHGGFFDHVAPLALKYRNGSVSFDSTGPRVPAIVAGPFAPQGVSHSPLDNTSILQLLAERFGHPGEPYSSAVAGRASTIASVSSVLSATAANGGHLPLAAAPVAAGGGELTSGNANMRAAFNGALQNLTTQHQAEAVAKYPQLAGRNFSG